MGCPAAALLCRGNMTNIAYRDKNIVIVDKPVGVASQPDSSGAPDMTELVRAELASLYEPEEIYVVHRLDLVVGGLLVYARNKATAARLGEQVSNGELGREYIAVIEGECESGEMSDYLVKNASLGKSIVVKKGRYGSKLARLKYEKIDTVHTERGARTLVKIKLITGRYHQIRAQFSSRSLPLVGDSKYGSSEKTVRAPALFAYRVNIHTDAAESFAILPDTGDYPWNLFSEEAYSKCLK